MNAMDESEKYAWLRVLYSEAWAQYRHEDDLGIKRSIFYITVQGAILALLAFTSKPLIDDIISLEPSGLLDSKPRLIAILAGLTSVSSTLLVIVAVLWKSANDSGRAYINMRWISAFDIERQLLGQQIGVNSLPAQFENAYRRYCFKTKFPSHYYPYRKGGACDGEVVVDGLETIKLSLLPKMRGWAMVQYSSVLVIAMYSVIGILSAGAAIWIILCHSTTL